MRIVISINTAWNVYNFRLHLIKSLLASGHEVIALANRDNYVNKIESLGVPFFHVCVDSKGVNPLNDLGLIFRYFKLFNKIKPDLILSFTIKPNVYGNLAARLLNISTINNISGLGTIFIKKSILTRIGKLLYKLSLKSSSHVFFQNADDKSLFVKNKLVFKKITSVVPGSGVDVQKFKCERANNKANRFLFVGRLINDKGVAEYLDAAVRVLEKHPKKEFLLIGQIGYNNKTALSKNQLEAYTSNYTNINYLGKTDNIISLLESVDVMVLPSYREGLSKSLIEAASMSLPIITTDVPGCRDVVEDGYNGFLCKSKSISSLEKAILKCIYLTEIKRLKLGEKGREKVIQKFTSQAVSKIYIDKIKEIINLKNKM